MNLNDIISATAETFIKQQGIVFEDWQLAWLLYYSDKDCRWIHTALEEIADNSSDTMLKDQIAFLVSREKTKMNIFQSNDGNAIYILREQFPDDYKPTRQGCYSSYLLAERAARMLQHSYSIEKVRFVQNEQDSIYEGFDEYIDDSLGTAHFYKGGGLKDTVIRETYLEDWEDNHSEEMFYERYFDFCHPFHTGDIVKRIGSDNTYISIIGVNPQRNKTFCTQDYLDSGILVNNFNRETGTMWDSDTYENPYLFDFLEISPDTDDLAERIILEWSKILKGEGGSMQYIQDGSQRLKEVYEEEHKAQYITGFQLRDHR